MATMEYSGSHLISHCLCHDIKWDILQSGIPLWGMAVLISKNQCYDINRDILLSGMILSGTHCTAISGHCDGCKILR